MLDANDDSVFIIWGSGAEEKKNKEKESSFP
jgi:hypothetical protein